ncbi:MAG TPA: SURF1 family protein, partial [Steroidobacteraceae bacterium]|nr:SURF1 family protein [Steroidobacteraceae bacterium]
MPTASSPHYRRRFAPSWWMTLLTIALCVLFVRLGEWQWHRGVHAQAEWDAFVRGADAPIAPGAQPLATLPRFKRIRVTGDWDAAQQFLLDNRSHAGLPGYEVLTPLRLAGDRVLLVDRGWVPFTGSRAHLPDIALRDLMPVSLTGRLDNLPVGGLALGHAAPAADGSWPKVTSFPTLAELATSLRHPVESWML